MSKAKNNLGKKLSIATLTTALVFAGSSAFAGTVTNMSGTDGFRAVPVEQGDSFIHFRVDSSFPSSNFVPNLHFVSGLAEGIDLGIGGGFNLTGLGTPAVTGVNMGTVYPWIRAAIPNQTKFLKTGVLVGSSIPVNNGVTVSTLNNSFVTNEFFPGITGLMDIYVGDMVDAEIPLNLGLNAGYARGISTGTNLLSGNVNLTLPLDNVMNGLSVYEEQYVNYPVGGFTNGGFRLGVNVPVGNRFKFDVKPAALWTATSNGTIWSFNPSVGLSYRF